MMSEFTGIQHPTHKRKAAQRRRKKHALKRTNKLARKQGLSTIKKEN